MPTCAILAPKKTVLKSRDYGHITISFCSLSVKLREERVLFVADWLIAFDLFLGVVLFVDVCLLERVRARKHQGLDLYLFLENSHKKARALIG